MANPRAAAICVCLFLVQVAALALPTPPVSPVDDKTKREILCRTETNSINCEMGSASSTDLGDSLVQGVGNMVITNGKGAPALEGYHGNINQVLDQVLSRLKLQEDEIKRTNVFIDDLVKKTLVTKLKKQSGLFAKLFKEIAWTGSFYEGLKISNPDEFDLNIVFKLPFKEELIKIQARDDFPGFVTVKGFGAALKTLEDDPSWKPVYHDLLKWTDHSGNLLQTKVRSWMEGIVTKFANEYNQHVSQDQKIKVTKSGPAMTLVIGKISIDVVPVFGFDFAPPPPIRQPKPLNRIWFIVPKPHKDGNGISDDAWRVSFYQFEKDILRDYGKIKPAIKLVKKLRDNQNWSKSLYSYSIKTVALWMKENGELKESDKIDIAFIKLLKGIQKYLESDDGFLPFYWEDRGNMLKMTTIERKNYSGRLSRLIKKFEENWDSNPAFIGDKIVPESAGQIHKQAQDHEKEAKDAGCAVC